MGRLPVERLAKNFLERGVVAILFEKRRPSNGSIEHVIDVSAVRTWKSPRHRPISTAATAIVNGKRLPTPFSLPASNVGLRLGEFRLRRGDLGEVLGRGHGRQAVG
jgi:hypothetical protein